MCSKDISVPKEVLDAGSSGPAGDGEHAIASNLEASALYKERYQPEYGILLNTIISKLKELIIRKQIEIDVAKEHLKTTQKKNEIIKVIVHERVDPALPEEFYNNVLKLNERFDSGLMALHKKIEDMTRAYEAAKVEKLQMERLVEQLSNRFQCSDMEVEPETSKNIPYLQKRIDSLEQELEALRKSERDPALGSSNNAPQDDEIPSVGAQLPESEKKSQEADKDSVNINSDSKNQTKISDLEQKMQCMQLHYHGIIEKLSSNQEQVKNQVEDLEEELIRTKTKALQTKCLQKENEKLRLQLSKYDSLLSNLNNMNKQSMSLQEQLTNKDCQFNAETDREHDK